MVRAPKLLVSRLFWPETKKYLPQQSSVFMSIPYECQINSSNYVIVQGQETLNNNMCVCYNQTHSGNSPTAFSPKSMTVWGQLLRRLVDIEWRLHCGQRAHSTHTLLEHIAHMFRSPSISACR